MSGRKLVDVRISPADLTELRVYEGIRRQQFVDTLADEYELPPLQEDGEEYDIDDEGNFFVIGEEQTADGEP